MSVYSVHVCYHRRGNCRRLFWYTCCFPLTAASLFPLNAECDGPFISGLNIARSRFSDGKTSLQWSSINLEACSSARYLVRKNANKVLRRFFDQQ